MTILDTLVRDLFSKITPRMPSKWSFDTISMIVLCWLTLAVQDHLVPIVIGKIPLQVWLRDLPHFLLSKLLALPPNIQLIIWGCAGIILLIAAYVSYYQEPDVSTDQTKLNDTTKSSEFTQPSLLNQIEQKLSHIQATLEIFRHNQNLLVTKGSYTAKSDSKDTMCSWDKFALIRNEAHQKIQNSLAQIRYTLAEDSLSTDTVTQTRLFQSLYQLENMIFAVINTNTTLEAFRIYRLSSKSYIEHNYDLNNPSHAIITQHLDTICQNIEWLHKISSPEPNTQAYPKNDSYFDKHGLEAMLEK